MPYQYVPRTDAQVEKRSNQSASKYVGIIKDEFLVFGARKDDNAIRILPPTWENPEHYGYDVWVHFGVGPDRGQVLCLSKMRRQPCPICEFQLKAESDSREDADDYKPRRRVLVWLVERKTEAEKKSTEENPQAWAMPWTVDRDISKICKDREDGHLYLIDHPDSGYDIFFDKSGEKELTKYTGFALSRRESSVNPAYIDFIVKNPLPTILQWRNYDEVKYLFEGDLPVKDAAHAEPKVGPVLVSAPPVVPVQIPQEPIAVPPPIVVTAPPPPPPILPPPPPPTAPVIWPPEGWSIHPSAAGYYYKGQEVLSEADLRARQVPAPPPAPVPMPPPPPSGSASERAAAAANALKARFTTGQK